MAKRKKTLEQKRLKDMHRQVYSLNNLPSIPSVKEKLPVTNSRPTTTTISYLLHDILKTSILTSAILIFQVLLAFLLKNHILRIPVVSY